MIFSFFFFFSSRRRHTRFSRDWSSDVCSSDLLALVVGATLLPAGGPNRVALAPWEQLNVVNVVGNVALFALPAGVLWSFGWSLRRTILAGLVLSVGIELLQLAIPGRTTATVDVLS